MANIAIAKLGKVIKFNEKTWTPIGGDNEAPYFMYAMAKAYPQHDFWIVGCTDYSQVFPNGLLPNIHDLWGPKYWDGVHPYKWIKPPYDEAKELHWKYYRYSYDRLQELGITIDFAFILYGMFFSTSMSDVVKSTIENRFTKAPVIGCQYTAPITYFLNEYKGEYASMVTDPRVYQSTIQRDYAHWPTINLSQLDEVMKFPGKSFNQYWPSGVKIDYKNEHPNVYSGLETMNLLSRIPYKEFPEKKGFAMICNQGISGAGNKKPPRYVELKKWILDDPNFDCSIYGKWDEDIIESDSRFKGPIPPIDLGNVLETIKYTLCIPIAPGWMTAKFVEMLHYGVIPFVTKDYGSKAGYQYIPKECIVNSVKELKMKIDYLEQHPEVYKAFWSKLHHILDDKYTGEYLFNQITENLKKYTSFDIGEHIPLTEPMSVLYKRDKEKNTIDEFF